MSANVNVLVSYFKKYDADNSGYITTSEFSKLCYDLGYYMDTVTQEAVLAQIDKDHSGKLEFTEFCNWWASQDKFKIFDYEKNPLILKAIEYFQKYDTDNSGQIGVAEYKQLAKDLGQVGLSEIDYKAGLKVLDKNKDGNIQFNEFISWLKWF
eukprot:TRINITY_DN856_c0_g1_i2.p1 TRINITY_DN856_c0_g1~~TRINITY_DN856_c0_g1_i2.p1  ORF type:complete len:153 (-),score=26.86 TRINITY_DN856_c0_g1_i2:67-525(-)